MSHRFQVNLAGIISLLSDHLYSGPEVFIREILQNSVDGIRARAGLSNQPVNQDDARIDIELENAGKDPVLILTDRGIGLTEDEIHRFLATIGESSKRDELGKGRADFIGQFGIGLLSCFLVADQIVVITQSAKGGDAMEWCGKPDGTYTVRALGKQLAVGTRVYLRAKADMHEYFHPQKIRDLVMHYGGLLPYPIYFKAGDGMPVHLNEDSAPWRQKYSSDSARQAAYARYGEAVFGGNYLDVIELRSSAGDVEGLAYVLPQAPGLQAKLKHRIYLKGMLLTESGEGILPDWAFFIRAVINANSLRPNAAREAFYENDALERARQDLGTCIAEHLKQLAKHQPKKLLHFVALHHVPICALASEDTDFLRVVGDMIPFDTSMGRMTLGEYLAENRIIKYAPTTDLFRQIASVAVAQNMCIINAGHSFEEDLLLRLPEVYPDVQVETIDAETITQGFEPLTDDEEQAAYPLMRAADKVLQSFGVLADVGRFKPTELATLYTTNREGQFWRSLEQTQETSEGAWADLLGDLKADRGSASTINARLTFNVDNPLVQRLCSLTDKAALDRCIEMLYVQALLLGHFPLSAREMSLLNAGLLGMIDLLSQQRPKS